MLITPVMEYPLQISSSKILENKDFFFFFCRHGCIGAKITAYIIVYFLKIQHQNDKSERERTIYGEMSLSHACKENSPQSRPWLWHGMGLKGFIQ